MSVFSAPILAQSLGAEGRGSLAGAFVSVQLLSWMAFMGLPRGMSAEQARGGEMSRRGFWVLTLLGLGSFVAVFLSADLLSNENPWIGAGIRVASFTLLLTGISQLGGDLLIAQGKLISWNVIRSFSLIFPSAFHMLAASQGILTLEIAFLGTLIGTAAATTIGAVYAGLALRRHGAGISPPWRFSLRYWSASAFDGLGGRIDQLLLVALVSASALGNYTVALTCASASGALTQALNHVSYSKFVNEETLGQEVALRKKSQVGIYISSFAGLLIVIIILLFGEQLFGPTFDNLAPIVAILIIFQLLNDQWQLRAYYDSARGTAGGLAVSSAAGILAMLASIGALYWQNELTALTMAFCIVIFGGVRLGVRALYQKAKFTAYSCRP